MTYAVEALFLNETKKIYVHIKRIVHETDPQAAHLQPESFYSYLYIFF